MEVLWLAFGLGVAVGIAHLTGIVVSIVTEYRYWPPGARDRRFYATWTFSNALNVAILAVVVLDWNGLGFPRPETLVVGGVLFVGGYAVAIKGGRDLGFEQTLGLEGEMQADGLYRYSRHPQYTGYVVATVGAWLLVGSADATVLLGIYLSWWLTLPLAEEPWLREQYGEAYERYCERVPRFVDLRSPSPPADDAGY
ncbi:hypothetical protein BRC81_00480 [Halobacteriales archaeon QS_1_68_20]|nr:MAG: hypothetical protein BRC81_00480 [Halobacteriales archaeon QS_1_68_20]